MATASRSPMHDQIGIRSVSCADSRLQCERDELFVETSPSGSDRRSGPAYDRRSGKGGFAPAEDAGSLCVESTVKKGRFVGSQQKMVLLWGELTSFVPGTFEVGLGAV